MAPRSSGPPAFSRSRPHTLGATNQKLQLLLQSQCFWDSALQKTKPKSPRNNRAAHAKAQTMWVRLASPRLQSTYGFKNLLHTYLQQRGMYFVSSLIC